MPYSKLLTQNEQWKSVNEFLKISTSGRIKSHGKLIKGEVANNGYRRVHVSHQGKDYKLYIHRLVAETFIENPESKPQVNHIDGNKLNNNINNLEWCTPSENLVHAYKTNLRSCKGEKNNMAKLTEKDVLEIRRVYKNRSLNFNTYKLAEKYGVTPKAIEKIVKRKTWTHM